MSQTEYYSDPLQEEIVRRLRADKRLAQIEIMHEERMDLLNGIKKQLASLGLVIVVLSVEEDCSSVNTRRPIFDRVKFAVTVTENVLMNRQPGKLQLPAKAVAKYVVEALWGFRPESMGGVIYTAHPAIKLSVNKKVLVYQANFKIGKD